MKDYRLSEIKAHCKARVAKYQNPCKGCEMEVVCKSTLPVGWNIEPRDMIELPYKEFHEVYHGQGLWFVFYRAEGGLMGSRYFNEEPEADAFLAELKGENNGN